MHINYVQICKNFFIWPLSLPIHGPPRIKQRHKKNERKRKDHSDIWMEAAAHAQLTNAFIIMPTMLICCCINFQQNIFASMIKNRAKRRKNANNNNPNEFHMLWKSSMERRKKNHRLTDDTYNNVPVDPYTKANLFCNSFLKHNHLRPFFPFSKASIVETPGLLLLFLVCVSFYCNVSASKTYFQLVIMCR